MKSKYLILLAVPFMALTSCNGTSFSDTATVDVYNLDILKDGNLESTKDSSIKVHFAKGDSYIPYLSFSQYAKLYDKHLDEGMMSMVMKTSATSERWIIYKEDGGQKVSYFIGEVDYSNKTFSLGGSIQNALKPDDNPRDLTALYYGLGTTGSSKQLGKSFYANYSFKDYDIDLLNEFNQYYLPLGLLDTTFSFNSGIYFYYNYKAIYSTSDANDYFEKEIGGKEYTVNVEALNNKKQSRIPSYLVDYNTNLFFYLLDNFYGLKDYKNFTSAKALAKNYTFYSDLFTTDGPSRVQAYSNLLTVLDDNHTALVQAGEVWGESVFTRYAGEGCYARSQLRAKLLAESIVHIDSSYRSDEHAIIYSDDGKTAMFWFNEFIFGTGEQVFKKDGSIRDSAKKYDTFCLFIDCFNQIKQRGGVENVILDMSTNGGGTLGVLMKLLALISKNNCGNLSYFEADSQILSINTSQVDINGDGVYDTDDCFGDDFNIYLLTSDCSFSCGNALPCCAQIAGDAKVIGQKTGGGECIVGIHYLPNGEYVYHSSNIHIGNFDENTNTFTGFEGGATPDISISDISKFFDINYLSNLVTKA